MSLRAFDIKQGNQATRKGTGGFLRTTCQGINWVLCLRW